MSLGSEIKNRRKSLGITQPELAEIAGVSVNTLYRIERMQANPILEILNRITDTLGLEIALKVKELNNS